MSTQFMKAAYLTEPSSIVISEVPIPSPGPGQVLIRVGSVGVCGSDTHYYRHGGIGPHVITSPLILGHEPSGTVIAAGEGVDGRWLGKRVSIEPGVPDGTCWYCRTGRYNLCPNMVFFATPPVDGAFVEYLVHPVAFVYELPDNVSDDAGALIEPLSVGLWANHLAGTTTGDRVLIAGAGPVGVLAAQTARVAGATQILISDPAESRRRFAVQHGATDSVDPRTSDFSGFGADVFIDCSGVSGAIRAGIDALRPGGTAILVGLGADSVELPMALLQDRELTVRGNFRYANTWPTGISLAARGLVELDPLVTDHFDLDGVEDALTLDPSSGSIKAVVRP